MSADLSCAVCGSEFDLTTAFASEVDRQALERLVSVSVPMGARVLQYLTLFTPPKQRLTAAKKIKLILQLLPDLERHAITHKGRDWAAPLTAWTLAIDQMLAARDAQRLELPMKGHSYLYAVIAAMADKHEAAAEQQREEEKRSGPRPARVEGPVSIGQALQPTFPPVTIPQTSQGMSPTVRRMREQVARNSQAEQRSSE